MAEDYVSSVKLLLKTLDTGVKLARSLSNSAGEASTEKALQIAEHAPVLQSVLEKGSRSIRDGYRRSVEQCGQPFSQTLVTDKSIKSQLDKLRNNLRDRVDEIEDDPESFEPTAFLSVQDQARECFTQCLSIFDKVRDQLLQSHITLQDPIPDDRSILTSMRQSPPSTKQRVLDPRQPLPRAQAETLQFPKIPVHPPPQPSKPPHSPWSIEGPSEFNVGLVANERRRSSRDISPSSLPEPQLSLISKDVVNSRLSANEEWLARRRESRILFQNELNNRGSIVSIQVDEVSQAFATRYDGSPTISSAVLGSPGGASSPVEGRTSRSSLNGYDTILTRERSQGGHSPRASRTSSIFQEQHRQTRMSRQESQESIFGLRGPPLSPPLSAHRSSTGPDGLPIIRPMQGFVAGIEEGLEAVTSPYDDGLIVVNAREEYNQPTTPSVSVKSIDYPMRHDTSFYKLKGFCEGAKAMLRGETGFTIVKRPSGHYSAQVSARCIKCSYEVGWAEIEKDKFCDKAGIYGNAGIRWRQRFLSKCHLRADSIDAASYACIFCIDEHRTVEDHDATVFLSVSQLFRHLATHQRPRPAISGLTILYGQQSPDVVDFDIHFTRMEPASHKFCMREIAQKVATRPSATAIQTFHPKNTHGHSIDPRGGSVLYFAVGAHIVGITFPEELGGTWCVGYHDGERGSFPLNTITLEKPDKQDYLMDDRSTLIAYAKWDFKLKDSKDSEWLQLKKGELITGIGYTFHDAWCWSGQTAKGKKFGLFPAAFVERCQDGGQLSSSATSLKSSSTLRSKFGGFSLSRNKSSKMHEAPPRHERSPSLRSSGSGSGPILVKGQPGLEVVASPIHGSLGWKT